MIRILVADDHAIMRRGLRGLLETHAEWHVCGEAGNGREADEACTPSCALCGDTVRRQVVLYCHPPFVPRLARAPAPRYNSQYPPQVLPSPVLSG